MKFSEYVKFRNDLLNTVSTDAIKAEIKKQSDLVKSLSYENLEPALAKHLMDTAFRLEVARDSLDPVTNNNTDFLNYLNKEIDSQAARFFDPNYKVRYNDDVVWIRQYRTVQLPLTDEVRNQLVRRIRAKADWHYPALEIGCADGIWTDTLVGGDPLYIVDTHKEFVDSTMNMFNPEYQRRLRPYVHDINKDWNYSYLPQQQFGFIFSWNQYNYIPFNELVEHLRAIFNLLRNGGTFIFTFNDGDTYQGADNADVLFMSYVPKSKLIAAAKAIGFEIGESEDYNNTVAWMELRKPGDLSTVKGHQVLGVVMDK